MFARLGEILNGLLLPFSKCELYPVEQNNRQSFPKTTGIVILTRPACSVEDCISYKLLTDPISKYSGCCLLRAKLVTASGLFPGLIASTPVTNIAEVIKFSSTVVTRPGIGPPSDDNASSEVVPDLDGLDLTRDLKDQQ